MTTGATSAAIPATDPFTAVAAHFGMLLGVDDLETIVGQPWAKMRLHNAWLHGSGVVWGAGVSVDGDSREIRVEPFLAVDELGRELMIATQSCVDLQKWYDANKGSVTNRGTGGEVVFDALVVAHHRACLDRAVPTLVSPCEGASADTAYSRLRETAELFLVPADSDQVPARVDRYPRLRALRGLPSTLADDDRDALRAQDAAATTLEQRLEVWRDAAAADVAARRPSTSPGDDPLFDGSEPAYVVLARLTDLTLSASSPVVASVEDIDLGARTAHVDTATIVDLLSGAGPAGTAPGDATGPRLVAGSAHRDADTVVLEMTTPVVEATLGAGVAVHRYDEADGWVDAAGGSATTAGTTVTVPLTAGVADDAVLRVVVSGTGPTPVVGPPPTAGAPPLPFCGSTDRRADPDGTDAVLTLGGSA